MNEPVIDSLIQRCLGHDRAAQYELYGRYSQAMYSTAVRILGQTDEAEDALQESFFNAFTNLNKYKGSASFGAWLKRITVNVCLNKLRKRKLKWIELDFDLVEEEHDVQPDLDVKRINEVIQKLPTGCRAVFVLKAIEGYSHEEIADELKISLSTSKSQYIRAKNLLSLSLKRVIEL